MKYCLSSVQLFVKILAALKYLPRQAPTMQGRRGWEGLKQGWVFVHSIRVLAFRQAVVDLSITELPNWQEIRTISGARFDKKIIASLRLRKH
jgi:hypothetical protein